MGSFRECVLIWIFFVCLYLKTAFCKFFNLFKIAYLNCSQCRSSPALGMAFARICGTRLSHLIHTYLQVLSRLPGSRLLWQFHYPSVLSPSPFILSFFMHPANSYWTELWGCNRAAGTASPERSRWNYNIRVCPSGHCWSHGTHLQT